jgi:hypothetical protein
MTVLMRQHRHLPGVAPLELAGRRCFNPCLDEVGIAGSVICPVIDAAGRARR